MPDLSMTDAITRIRTLVESVDGIKRAYSDHEDGNDGLPGGLFEVPAALVLAGPTVSFEQKPTQWMRHIYDVRILVLASHGEISERGYSTGPIVDQVIDVLNGNVTMGARVEWCRFDRQNGYTTFNFGDQVYSGYELVMRVSEKSAITSLAFGA